MTTDNFCFYLQTGQTGGQLYSDTSPFSVPWVGHSPHPPRVKGLSPAAAVAGTRREKETKIFLKILFYFAQGAY
jgi:hypothetical protein